MHRRSPWCDLRFRGAKPQLLLAEPSVFSGLAALPVARLSISPGLLRTGLFYFANPFSHRRTRK